DRLALGDGLGDDFGERGQRFVGGPAVGVGALGEREQELSAVHGGLQLGVSMGPVRRGRQPVTSIPEKRESAPKYHMICVPYISPSGSLISSSRTPSGSRKYSDVPLTWAYSIPAASSLSLRRAHVSGATEIARCCRPPSTSAYGPR